MPNDDDDHKDVRDAMLDYRINRVESDQAELKADLKSEFKEINAKLHAIERDLAEIKGRLSQVPNVLQLLAITISTWMAGAGMVFALVKFGLK